MNEKELKAFPPLSVPYADLRIAKDEEGNLKVFDSLRNKYVNLTPEEFVRQNFVGWLIRDLHYPASLMANEVEIKLNGTRKRCDSVIYGKDLNPIMILEFKAPGVEITQSTFDQIVRYNRELKAKYLVVSNGKRHYCCIIDYFNDTYNFIPRIPDFNELDRPGIN